ncbi:MAG TPA: NmrA family NAD(P)-binding protein, partial [Solirubrobacteraceae bacterium]
MLLITGANGKLGRLIVEEVLRRAPDAPLAVSVRDASAAADLAERGVDVRQADYHDADSLRAAFAGVDRLLLMPTPTPDPEARVAEMLPVAQAAADAGVRHVVYPGAAKVENLDFPLFDAHARVFDGIAATGVQTTHLRHNIYAEFVAGDVAGAIAAGELAAPVNGAQVSPVLRSDLAAAIATVLLEDGHEGKTYALTGPDAVGWEQLAELASQQAGNDIPFRSIDDTEAQ